VRKILSLLILPLSLSGCVEEWSIAPEPKRLPPGGSVFNHIRTFEIDCETVFDEAGTDFVATHFDVFVGGGVQIPRVYESNPNIVVLEYAAIRANSPDVFGPDCEMDHLCIEQFAADHGYDPEDYFLHYKEDVTYVMEFPDGGTEDVFVPGWNPDWQPGDPPASAAEESESRVWGRWALGQRWANVESVPWRHWKNECVSWCMVKNGQAIDGVLVDGVIRIEDLLSLMQFDKTHEYLKEPFGGGHSHIDDAYSYIPVLSDHLEGVFGESKIVVGNAEASYWLVSEAINSVRLQETFDWLLVENGVRFDTVVHPETCSHDVQFQDTLRLVSLAKAGNKILFGGKDNSNTDRGRLFILSTFYLVNHPNLYFCNHKVGIHWFEAIAHDIGYPLGDAYLWACGPDGVIPSCTYHVMAREYSGALVLVKLRDSRSYYQYFGTESTHDLGGMYRPLRANGTLGDPVTEITLWNNEAAILIPVQRGPGKTGSRHEVQLTQ
jgi:hypothetical protein